METNNKDLESNPKDRINPQSSFDVDQKINSEPVIRTVEEFQVWLDKIFKNPEKAPMSKNENQKKSDTKGRIIEVTFFPKLPPKKK